MHARLLAALTALAATGCTCGPGLVPSSFALSVVTLGEGSVVSDPVGVDCGAGCSAVFKAGTNVTLSARPVTGGSFLGWEGDCAGTDLTCVLAADRAHEVVARFGVAVALTLTGGSGRVVSTPAGLDCTANCAFTFDYDIPVALTATPLAGFAFEGWAGDCTGSGSCTVTTDVRRNVTARFVAAPAPCDWVKHFGGPYREGLGALKRDAATGRLLLAGTTQGNIDFGGGALTSPSISHLFVAVLDAAGAYQSAFLKGAASQVTLGDGAAWLPDGDVAVAGAWSGKVDFGDGLLRDDGAVGFGLFRGFLGAWSPTGALRRFQPLGETTVLLSGFSGLATQPLTGITTVAGTFAAPESFGGPTPLTNQDFDAYAAQYDADGGFRWAARAGGADYDTASAVAVQSDGTTLVAGMVSGLTDLNGGAWDASGPQSAFVAGYGSDGGLSFSHLLVPTDGGYAEARAVAAMPSGDAVAVGGYSGSVIASGVESPPSSGTAGAYDAFVARLGAQPWFARIGGALWDEADAVVVDPGSEDVWVLGTFRGTVTFQTTPVTSRGGGDIFLARYAKTGQLVSVRTFGGTGEDFARGLQLDPFGRVLVAGEFEGVADFGLGALTSRGDVDVFLGCFVP